MTMSRLCTCLPTPTHHLKNISIHALTSKQIETTSTLERTVQWYGTEILTPLQQVNAPFCTGQLACVVTGV